MELFTTEEINLENKTIQLNDGGSYVLKVYYSEGNGWKYTRCSEHFCINDTSGNKHFA